MTCSHPGSMTCIKKSIFCHREALICFHTHCSDGVLSLMHVGHSPIAGTLCPPVMHVPLLSRGCCLSIPVVKYSASMLAGRCTMCAELMHTPSCDAPSHSARPVFAHPAPPVSPSASLSCIFTSSSRFLLAAALYSSGTFHLSAAFSAVSASLLSVTSAPALLASQPVVVSSSELI